ncbi:hypothetical protein MYX64_08500 [Nitrospinae bacterium AH_259_B05_G02_I21]|jgi:hypothetical protein|nr:hypothetical protein [Nitrospinae bacterium AH_259_B05_G02_I21]MDA2932427.1 hypothetical protein [Nitrospinae bacterium AH-259-F20]
MGRTVLSATQVVLREQKSWRKFRRALRKEDQEAFDELFQAARYHVAALSYASKPTPLEPILISMLIEQHKAIRALEERVKALEGQQDDG